MSSASSQGLLMRASDNSSSHLNRVISPTVARYALSALVSAMPTKAKNILLYQDLVRMANYMV